MRRRQQIQDKNFDLKYHAALAAHAALATYYIFCKDTISLKMHFILQIVIGRERSHDLLGSASKMLKHCTDCSPQPSFPAEPTDLSLMKI